MSNKWDNYFMGIAEQTANLSKDSTKVGAVIVKDRNILSVGYNGAPRMLDDNIVPMDCSDMSKPLKEQKYSYICHAELNAILNYSGHMKDFQGATLYTTVSPCHDCAKMLCQAGVKKVIYKTKYHREEIANMSDYMFKLCNVECEKFT